MGGGKGGGSQTVQQKSDPWKGIQPYLVGSSTRTLKPGVKPIYGTSGGMDFETWKAQNPGRSIFDWAQQNAEGSGSQVLMNPDSDYVTTGTPGLYPEASRIYGQSQYTPEMSTLNKQNINQMWTAIQNPHYQNVWESGDNAQRGMYDPRIQAVNLGLARQSQGALDPTQSYQQMLSGIPNNPYLKQMTADIFDTASKNLAENVLPQIRSGAVANGYGSSRQGIAEGKAIAEMNDSATKAANQLYGNAYEAAQSRMASAADALNQQAFNNAFNNNSQEMQRAGLAMNNRTTGANLLNLGFGGQQNLYNNVQGLYNQPNQYNWQQLQNYSNILSPGLGVGSSSSSTTSKDAGLLGSIGQIGNTALTGAMAYQALTNPAMFFASDERIKTDIKKVGKTDDGLNVYTYRYKAGGPMMMGVMAQEVEKVKPDAVREFNGIKMVNYGMIGG